MEEGVIKVDETLIGSDYRPYIIAEVGINAWDDTELAKSFIQVAADAGADAVKFQTHFPEHEMVEQEMRRIEEGTVYDTVARCEWSLEDHYELQSFADHCGITFLSTPFSVEAVDVLDEIEVPAIKIGSGEMNNRHLTKYAAGTGKPLLVSTGMNALEDVEVTCEFLNEVAESYALLYCVSEYPTTAKDFDFQTISRLKKLSGGPVGFSDHSVGVEAAKVAIGNGATFVEKHFTIDRRLPGPDQEVSIEPEELADLCDFATLYHETSTERDGLHSQETEIKRWAQHSVVATRTIEKGMSITEKNTTTKRPATGISAEKYYNIIGSKSAKNIAKGEVIKESSLEG